MVQRNGSSSPKTASMALPMLLLCFVLSSSNPSSRFAAAFTPNVSTSTNHSNTHSIVFPITTPSSIMCNRALLRLHPDQGEDLMAAASELMKTQSTEDVKEDTDENNGEKSGQGEQGGLLMSHDDTKKYSSSPYLSATSSSLQAPRKWWSAKYASFIRRHNHSG